MEGNLLFIDDDPDILHVNYTYFSSAGFTAGTAATPEEALKLLEQSDYNCIILDIRMEGSDGYELCRYIQTNYKIPVIFLTSLTEEEALLKGFISGAIDYVTKPYSLKELETRIRLRMRPLREKESSVLKAGRLTLDPSKKQASVNGAPVNLTVNEFEILYFLAMHKGEPFTPDILYQHIWHEDGSYQSHSIQTMILRIRKKLIAAYPEQEFIRTRWGKGYVFISSPEDD